MAESYPDTAQEPLVAREAPAGYEVMLGVQGVRPGYKLSEVGVIPEDWEVKPLGKIIRLQRGFDLPHRDRRPGATPIVSSSGICAMHNQYQAIGPGVVTGRYGTIGEVFFIQEDYWPLNTTLFVKDFKGNDPLFVSYLLRTVDFHSHSGKSGVPGVNRNDLHELPTTCPPLPEQRAIAAALSDVDALLAKLDQLIAKKRDLKQAAMQQLLTGQTRLPGFDGEWEVKRLGDVCPLQRGFDLLTTRLRQGCYPVVYSNGVLNYHNEFMVKGPGVVTGRSGTIGNVHFVEKDFWPHNTSLWVTSFKGNSPKFIFYLLGSIGLERFGTGSGVPTLNRNDVHAHSVRIPPSTDEQSAIATVLSDMDAELAALEARRDKTRALKQGMMQELLTGRIRLV